MRGGRAGRVLAIANPAERRIFLTVAPEELPEAVRTLRDGLGFTYLATITGLDKLFRIYDSEGKAIGELGE